MQRYIFEVFSRQYPVVVFFVQHLAYNRGLKSATASLTDHKEFWASTTDAHLKLATLAWCNVFGSRKEDLHWTKILGSFNLTEQSLGDLEEDELSNEILEKLQALKNLEFNTENAFLVAVENEIGRDQTVRYKEPILKHANNIDEQAQQDFRHRVLSKTGFTR